MTRWPIRYPVTAAPSSSMTPTGSWPTVSPRATGYSPFRMCTSVPQIVVVVMRRRASVGPTEGVAFSCKTMRPGSTKTAAFMVPRTLRGPGMVAAGADLACVGSITSGHSLPDDEHAAGCVRDHVRCDAPEKEFLDPGRTAGPDDH